jgi:predicted membrane protein
MSINAHAATSTSSRPMSHRLPILSMVALCVAVDIAGIRFMAQNWDYVSHFAPHLLLAMAIAGVVMRARSVLTKKD